MVRRHERSGFLVRVGREFVNLFASLDVIEPM
jgi:hypothetical protein